MPIRNAGPTEVPCIAAIWHSAWRDAHEKIVPGELAAHRTLESFEERLFDMIGDVRVATSDSAPVGFCIVKDDELYQLFVTAEARGTGIAAELVADAEAILAAKGVKTAWLACAIGNERAARFYERSGWRRVGSMINEAVTKDGIFELETWRYEKLVGQP